MASVNVKNGTSTRRIKTAITKKDNNEFVKALKAIPHDKPVEVEVVAPLYRDIIKKHYKDGYWDFQGGTDGFFVTDNLFFSMRLLLEAKYDLNLRDVADRAVIIAQCIYYMKKFQRAGHAQPTVILGGDRDQMFVVYAPPLMHYLERDFDWTVAPSAAARANLELVDELRNNKILATFVYDINERSFDVSDVMVAIDSLAQNAGHFEKIKIIPQNIRVVYDEFFSLLRLGEQRKIDTRLAVHLFISSIIGKRDVYVDEKRKNLIHLGEKQLNVDTVAYEAFFSRYEKNYTQGEIDEINSMYDILFEETKRRRSGDYWTPTIWADRAHDLISHVLGDGWRANHVVWDSACGTRNLTRDYTDFDALYLSTLFQEEIDTSKMYNQTAEVFQFDFLNDDIDIGPGALFGQNWKMPPTLYRALVEDKPIIFLINPPYGTASGKHENSNVGVSKNNINKMMLNDKIGRSSNQLYAQFVYRIIILKETFNLTNVSLGIFSNERFMRGGNTWSKFMKRLQENFTYRDGFFFNAGEFSDVAHSWGISFTFWTTPGEGRRTSFPVSVESSGPAGIETIATTDILSVDQEQFLSEWVREATVRPVVYQEEGSYVRLSSALDVNRNAKAGKRGKLLVGALGYEHNNSNTVEQSGRYVDIYSTAFGTGDGFSVTPTNFDRAVVNFAVRKSLIPTADEMWIHGHENYLRPSEAAQQDPRWPEFVNDCLLFSLCSPSGSNQSALRGVDYMGKSLNVMNDWFFLSRRDMSDLAEEHNFADLKRDVKTHGLGERFVYTEMLTRSFSHESIMLSNSLRRLVVDSFPFREAACYENPSMHYAAWDAGFWQIYLLAKSLSLPCLDAYRDAFVRVRDKIKDRALEFNFLG